MIGTSMRRLLIKKNEIGIIVKVFSDDVLRKVEKSEEQMKNIKKIILLNAVIVVVAVVCYSQGFMNLRPTDDSIFRAGMSIMVALGLIFALVYGNIELLKEKKIPKISNTASINVEDAERLLKSYFDGGYVGDTAKAAEEQLHRLLKSFQRAEELISDRFDKGSMSWEKYYSVVDTAKVTALQNIVSMANRMQMFDEKEYQRLVNYKDDLIPDDVQEQQLALYDKNLETIRNGIAVNEKLLLKMDTLSLELSDIKSEYKPGDAILEEIEKLTSEVKLYQM